MASSSSSSPSAKGRDDDAAAAASFGCDDVARSAAAAGATTAMVAASSAVAAAFAPVPPPSSPAAVLATSAPSVRRRFSDGSWPPSSSSSTSFFGGGGGGRRTAGGGDDAHRRFSAVLPRELCSDRKGMFDQFGMRALIVSTMRVSLTQASNVATRFVTDQLEEEFKTEELVVQGKLTPEEADEKNDRWEKREWSVRWRDYPPRALRALLRYHSVTFLMRLIERALSAKLTPETMDRLTRDTFRAAVRNGERGLVGREMRERMWYGCLWANAVAFGADYLVSQGVLIWGYWSHHRAKRSRRTEERRRRKKEREEEARANSTKGKFMKFLSLGKIEEEEQQEEEEEDDEIAEGGAMMLSLAVRSCRLFVSRSAALAAASFGGALGSQAYPGWGTLMGTSAGDGLAAAALE